MEKLKLNDIKEKFNNADIKDYEKLVEEFSSDERATVQKYLMSCKKKIDKYQAEIIRMKGMYEFENKYSDFKFICGIDEVGRGPLAGPVCAGAVILPKDCDILYLNDSKQVSAKMREELSEIIKEKAVSYATALVGPDVIDEINILQATYEAMRQAINKLNPAPDILLNDAVTIPKVNIKQVGIIKGDARSASIAAASIIAKVERDKLMVEYDKLYSGYGFASNKGYGSKEHIEALKNIGPCPIHRRTFIKELIR